MEYPKSFVDKAKRLYPNWVKLHELLDKGSMMVPILLNDRPCNGSIPIAAILNAKSLKELQAYAEEELERAELYIECSDICEKYRKNRNAQKLKEIEEAHARGERLT